MNFKNPNSKRRNIFRDIYNNDRYVNAAKYRDESLGFPLLVDMELTNHCNLKCFFCAQIVMMREKGYMSEEVFKKVVDECALHNTPIRLVRWGEPFLHKGIMDFCWYIKSKNLPVHVTTNGYLLTDRDIETMMDMELDSIKFSFQGATEDRYRQMRNTDGYNRLRDNIMTLVKIRGERKNPYIHISNTVTDETPKEIDSFVDYWKNIVDSVGIGRTSLSMFRAEEIKEPLLAAKFKALKKQETLKKEHRPCGEVYRQLSIDWDGKVSACCSDFDNELTVGHVSTSSLEEIWKKSGILKSIRNILDHGMHRSLKRCSSCYQYYDDINNVKTEYKNA